MAELRFHKNLLLRDPRGWIATGFGSGLSPVAPGTVGTLAALPIWLVLGGLLPVWAYSLSILAVFGIGVWASAWVILRAQAEDPGFIVIDEWVGVGLAWLPVAYWPKAHAFWTYVIATFLLFRGFDILKIWPVSWADQKLSGGFGAMLDDALAGLWAMLTLIILLSFFPLSRWP